MRNTYTNKQTSKRSTHTFGRKFRNFFNIVNTILLDAQIQNITQKYLRQIHTIIHTNHKHNAYCTTKTKYKEEPSIIFSTTEFQNYSPNRAHIYKPYLPTKSSYPHHSPATKYRRNIFKKFHNNDIPLTFVLRAAIFLAHDDPPDWIPPPFQFIPVQPPTPDSNPLTFSFPPIP